MMLVNFRTTAVVRKAIPVLPVLCRGPTSRMVSTQPQKKEGSIADAFASLSGQDFRSLEPRFAAVKNQLIQGREEAVVASWNRLLKTLNEEISIISDLGSRVIPEISFKDIDRAPDSFKKEYKKRGVAVIRAVIPEEETLKLKEELRTYIKGNPQTKAFPQDNPQVYELYWSPTQVRARGHPNMLKAQKFLMGFWRSKDPQALISTSHPISYVDRLRMRQPGDAKFALGPHVDGGSCERWEPEGYGRGHVYDKIWEGKWEEFDPWESSCRLPVKSDLYQGVGACSAFRMAQGWLSMSNTGPFEGTLLVNPLLAIATSYILLRPFFKPKTTPSNFEAPVSARTYLSPDNWVLESPMSSWLYGANPGRAQELTVVLHPHLELNRTMVHMPRVRPGDYVIWHCDTIHAVDKIHTGKTDSSVLYIPACPLTEENAHYLARQRDCFIKGTPPSDFPGGIGESQHVGRASLEHVASMLNEAGMRAIGLRGWDLGGENLLPEQKKIMQRSNEILGFA